MFPVSMKVLPHKKLNIRVNKNLFGRRNCFIPKSMKSLLSGNLNIPVEKIHFGGRNSFVPRENEDFPLKKNIGFQKK